MIETLKSRRNSFTENALRYYRFLSEEALVNGSDEEEIFKVTGDNSGLVVTVFHAMENTEPFRSYERHFIAGETFCITLNGFGGTDRFEIDKTVSSKIRIIINTGAGRDVVEGGAGLRLKVNDDAAKEDEPLQR
jgi:hypothetical protein